EEAQIAVEEEAQIFYPVAKHGQALEPRAEGEADVALGIEAEVLNHRRMHLSRAGDLEPAALQRPAWKHEVDLGRRLGEREVRRAETHLQLVVLEEAAQELGVHALE